MLVCLRLEGLLTAGRDSRADEVLEQCIVNSIRAKWCLFENFIRAALDGRAAVPSLEIGPSTENLATIQAH